MSKPEPSPETPKGPMVSQTVRLPEDLNSAVGHYIVDSEDKSFQQFVLRLIRAELDKEYGSPCDPESLPKGLTHDERVTVEGVVKLIRYKGKDVGKLLAADMVRRAARVTDADSKQ